MSECQNCSLCRDTTIEGGGSYKSGIAIVLESPTINDIAGKKHLSGSTGELLKKVFTALDVDLSEVYITYTCLCPAKPKLPLGKVEIDLCRERLLGELKDSRIKKILVFGNAGVTSLFPEWKTTVSKCRGRAVWSKELRSTVLCTYTPLRILMDIDLFRDLTNDIEKFVNMGTTEESVRPPSPGWTKMCRSVLDVKNAVKDLMQANLMVCDLETTSLNPFQGQIVLMGLRGSDEGDYHIPGRLLRNPQVVKYLKEMFESDKLVSAGHNVCFDSKWIKHHLKITWNPQIDTMLAHYCLDERSADEDASQGGTKNITGHHGLKTLAREYYNAHPWEEELKAELKSRKSRDFSEADEETLSTYLSYDTLYTYLLAHDLPVEMEADDVKRVHDEILIPATQAIRDIELRGAMINVPYLKEVSRKLQEDADEILKELQAFCDEHGLPNFNPNSSLQVKKLVFGVLGCPSTYGTSTDKGVLVGLANQYPLCQLILDYRQKIKLDSTYATGLVNRVEEGDRIHGEFLLHGTVTGRLSSRNPNLQNMPNVVGPLIREAFIATPGWTLIEGDYSQLELRVAGWYSNDLYLVDIYRNDKDIHMTVATAFFNKPPEEITGAMRYIAKTIVFGLLYGRGSRSMAHALMFERGTSELSTKNLDAFTKEAEEYTKAFLTKFVELHDWIKEMHRMSVYEGYTQTPFGRKRRYPFVDKKTKGEIERYSVNTPIQSMASDLCLKALIRINKRFNPEYQRIIMTVHDSLMCECKLGYEKETTELMREEMQKFPFETPLPFVADFKTGFTWGSMIKWSKWLENNV